MKTLLITTAFLTAPMVSSVTAQTSDALKRQISEQNRQIGALETQVTSLQSQLNLERKRSGKTALTFKASSKSPSSSAGTHTVKSGDTFSDIARKHGVSLASLIAANKGVSPEKLAINQKLVIPQMNTTAKTTAKPVTKTTSTKSTVTKKATPTGQYTVQKGDTYYGIAKRNNTTVDKLIAVNPKVKPTKLRPGLVINLPSTGSTAKAAKKTAVAKVASRPKVTVKATPKSKTTAATTAAVKSKATPVPVKHTEPTNVAKTVTVTSVMTYGQFASKNGTTISVLNAMNGLDLPSDEPMAVGSALYVPSR